MCIHKFVFEQALKRVAKTLAQQECLDLAMMSVKCCPLWNDRGKQKTQMPHNHKEVPVCKIQLCENIISFEHKEQLHCINHSGLDLKILWYS